MLVLSRKLNQSIMVGDDVRIVIVSATGIRSYRDRRSPRIPVHGRSLRGRSADQPVGCSQLSSAPARTRVRRPAAPVSAA